MDSRRDARAPFPYGGFLVPHVSTGASMSDLQHIDDPRDPRIAEYVALNDPELRQGREAGEGFFIAESPHVVATVARAGRRIRSVLVTPKQQRALGEFLATLPCPVYVADEPVMRRTIGFDLHRGIVAAVDRWPLPEVGSVVEHARLLAVCERVNDHENLGVLFRNAAAFGLDAVLLDPESSDPLYRRAVRVSIGHVCTLPWTRYERLAQVRSHGFTLVALTPGHDATPIDGLAWPERTALLLGSEGTGLSDATLAAADARVRIPMRADVDSLNVATAAAVAFYAATRGR
jgi:tRNA G18 (ribose-2'-O)-methylase SpoU